MVLGVAAFGRMVLRFMQAIYDSILSGNSRIWAGSLERRSLVCRPDSSASPLVRSAS